MPLLVLAFFLVLEAAFRLAHFGVPAIFVPWRYKPFEILRLGLTLRVPNPQIGRRLRPNVHAWLKGRSFSTNSAGFRDREFALSPAPGVIRIAVLGTSIEMGSGVADEEIYSRRLQEKLDAVEPGRFEVLNFALSGASFAQIVALYDTFVAHYRPDAVMLPLRARGLVGPSHQRPPQRGRQYVRPMLDYLFAYGAMRKAVGDWTKEWLSKDWLQRGVAREPRQSPLTILAPFFRARAREGVAVFLVTPPTLKDPEGRRMDRLVDEAMTWTHQFGNVHLIDVRQHLAESITGSDYAFYGDLHPNAHVHEQVAAAIFAQWDALMAQSAVGSRQ